MSREFTLESVVLKKQPFGEADELVSVFTRAQGKLTCLAKSVKFSKSKLQYGLQPLFFVRLRLAGAKLPKVIGAEVANSFKSIRENYRAITHSLYAVELALKFTPDGEKNEQLFLLLLDYFNFLDNAVRGQNLDEKILDAGLAKFKISFLESLGLGISAPNDLADTSTIGFSSSRGGFVETDVLDFRPVSNSTLKQFLQIRATDFKNTGNPASGETAELQSVLSEFIHYHLERDIKSEKYLLNSP